MKYCSLITVLLAILFSCSDSPLPEDYFGTYRIIKVRENGKVLNVSTNGTELNLTTIAQISLDEELYVSEIDRDGDGAISDNEIEAVSYSFHINESGDPYLIINEDDSPVELLKEKHFDLLLRKIDNLGNETILYLKKL